MNFSQAVKSALIEKYSTFKRFGKPFRIKTC